MTHPDAGALLKLAEEAFEFIRLKLVTDLEEPQRSAFWKAVEMRDNLRQAASQGSAGGEVPICCYCDNTLCCAHCGKEQPADASPPVKTGGGERSAVQSEEPYAWTVERLGDKTFPRIFKLHADAAALVNYCNVGPLPTMRPLYLGVAQASGTISDADVFIVTARLRGLNVLKEDYGQLSEGRVRKALEASTLTSAHRGGE